MKSSLLLLSSLALLASCNGGAGGAGTSLTGSGSGTTTGTTGTTTSAPASAIPDATIPVDTNATVMKALVDAINNSADSITITEAVHVHDAGDGAGSHELGTITLKCTPRLMDNSGGGYAGSESNYVKTLSGDKYIVSRGGSAFCVPQKDTNFDLLTAGLPELSAFARAGDIDYLVVPGTFELSKFHYAAQAAGCKLSGPIVQFDDLSPITNTCMNVIAAVPLYLTKANFRNGYYAGNAFTFVDQIYANTLSSAISTALHLTVIDSNTKSLFNADFTTASVLANGTILDPSLLVYDSGAQTLDYSGTSLPLKELSYKANGVFLYNGVPRFYTKVNESVWGTMMCKNLNCTTDGPIH